MVEDGPTGDVHVFPAPAVATATAWLDPEVRVRIALVRGHVATWAAAVHVEAERALTAGPNPMRCSPSKSTPTSSRSRCGTSFTRGGGGETELDRAGVGTRSSALHKALAAFERRGAEGGEVP